MLSAFDPASVRLLNIHCQGTINKYLGASAKPLFSPKEYELIHLNTFNG